MEAHPRAVHGSRFGEGIASLAWIAAALLYHWLTRGAAVKFPPFPAADWYYISVFVFGAGVGAVSFGTANLWLSQQAGFARSIEGALAGGIVAVELYNL